MADRIKSSAHSHTHKVVCPHCEAEISYRNLKRHLESLHPEKDPSGFHLKYLQSDKLLKPTKLTTFISLKRKEEYAVSDSPRPVKYICDLAHLSKNYTATNKDLYSMLLNIHIP